MPRPRKVPIVNKENKPEAEPKGKKNTQNTNKKLKIDYELAWTSDGKNVATLIMGIQKNPALASKTISDLRKIHASMGHKKFVEVFNKVVLAFLIRPDSESDNVTKMLKFIGNFVASFGEDVNDEGDSHPLIGSTFDLLLSKTSKFIHVRARICMLVAHIMMNFSPRAEIDADIIDNILARIQGTYVRDSSPLVRQNALLALQRLQDPENSEDSVIRIYLFHMECDPVAKVRMTAITSIAKKLYLMPNIIDRLHDVDEKVRRHVYLMMSAFPVKTYRIIDRISFLKAGLNDRSEKVRELIANIFLPNWIAAYEKDYAEFIKAIKMDSSDKELTNFRELAQKALQVVLEKQTMSDLLDYLKITEESEYPKCIQVDKTASIEWLIVWKMAIQTFQNAAGKVSEENNDDSSDHEGDEKKEEESIVPELSVMCNFIEKFTKNFKGGDGTEAKYQNLIFNHSLITLLEIVQLCDLSDEVGCARIRELLKYIIMEHDIIEFTIKEISEIIQKINKSTEDCLNFFNDILLEMIGSGASESNRKALIDGLIEKTDMTLKVKVNGMKMELMDLKEKEEKFVDRKEYGKAQKVKEQHEKIESELLELLRPYYQSTGDLSSSLSETLKAFKGAKKMSPNEVVKNLQTCFYSLMIRGVKTMNHKTLEIYNTFVCYHLESPDNFTKSWALKTATACSMLYEPLAKEVIGHLKGQIFTSHSPIVWETAITGIVDLLLRYGIEKMNSVTNSDISAAATSRSKKGGRTLYSTADEDDDECEETGVEKNIDVIVLLNHVHDSELDPVIQRVSTIGLCKLIFHGQYSTRELVAKFLVAFFNPATDSEISQIIGMFFENLVKHKKQELLAEALVLTLKTLIESPHDSPLREVKLETVVQYVIEVTRPVFCANGLNLHNVLSMKLLEFMADNLEEKEIVKIIPKELLTLEIGDDPLLKRDLIVKIDSLFTSEALDNKFSKPIKDLKSILEGTYRTPLTFSSTAGQLNEENKIDEDENEEAQDDEKDKDESEQVELNESEKIEPEEGEKVQLDESIIPEVKECRVDVTILSKSLIEDAEQLKIDEDVNETKNDSLESEVTIMKSINAIAQEFATPNPKTPANTRRSVSKRQIFTPKTFESPVSKRASSSRIEISGNTTTIVTPNFKTLPTSTPNTDRQTRSRAKLETVQTRSKSASSNSSKERPSRSRSKK